MAWKHIDKPVSVRCTKAIVKEFAEMEPAPNDRVLRDSRMSFIKSEIDSSTFRVASFASCYCKETKKTYRVNGKHTSTVLCSLNGHFPKDLWAFVERYEADTVRDVADLYSTFDRRESLRTTNDINKAFAAANPELCEIPTRILSLAVTGMSYHKWEGCYSQKPVDMRAALALDNPTFVLWIYFLFTEGDEVRDRKFLKRGAVSAAMFATWGKSPKVAGQFWESVRDESIAQRDNPTRVLARYLREATIRSQRHAGHSASHHEMYVKCIHAWNAYRGGESTTLKYYSDKPTPPVR